MQKIITTQEKEVEFYDADTEGWVSVSLPERQTVIQETELQWRDTRQSIEWLQNNGFKILNSQFGDARKTAYYMLDNSIFDDFMLADEIKWDNVYHAERQSIPEVGQLKIVAQAIISANPQIKNEIKLGMYRYWCSNGATSTVFQHRISIENPRLNSFEQAIAKLPAPQILQDEIQHDIVLSSNPADKIQNFRDNILRNLISHNRGENPVGLSSKRLSRHYRSLINTPNWFKQELNNQFQMIQDSEVSKLIALDIDNAITNVINHGHKNPAKRNQNFYLMRNSAAISNSISTALSLS